MPNRVLCQVFNEMRTCLKTLNFSYLEGLIEEAQVMGNRMEAALWDQHDYDAAKNDLRELRKTIRELEMKKEQLEDDQAK